jgi:hypothetical protein
LAALEADACAGLVIAERAGLATADDHGALAVLHLVAGGARHGEALAGAELLAGWALGLDALVAHESVESWAAGADALAVLQRVVARAL